MERFESSRHAYGESYLHLQFTPKYRREIFVVKLLQEACAAHFGEVAARLHIRLEACEFGPDHVHIFIGGWKNYTIPQLAQFFKGTSSHELRRDFAAVFVRFKLDDSMWSDGYFYETCGSVTAQARRYYIERLQAKHW